MGIFKFAKWISLLEAMVVCGIFLAALVSCLMFRVWNSLRGWLVEIKGWLCNSDYELLWVRCSTVQRCYNVCGAADTAQHVDGADGWTTENYHQHLELQETSGIRVQAEQSQGTCQASAVALLRGLQDQLCRTSGRRWRSLCSIESQRADR